MTDEPRTVHIPVLLDAILDHCPLSPGQKVIDCTFGGGGYTSAFLAAEAQVLALDQDATALQRRPDLTESYPRTFFTHHTSFTELTDVLSTLGWPGADLIVADLGFSSDQLDDPTRGFSYQAATEGAFPLDMRMHNTGPTGADMLNRLTEHELTTLFRTLADEPRAKPLARQIVTQRTAQPFATTADFLHAIEVVYPPRAGLHRRHPAQRLFQALRMEVNQELPALEALLPQARDALNPGGTLAMVTFHSLEDRMVKNFMRDQCTPTRDHIGRETAKSPFYQPKRKVEPTVTEVEANPRARSATLRLLRRRQDA